MTGVFLGSFGPSAMMGGSSTDFDVSYVASYTDTANLSTYTFSAVDLGVEDPTREIFIVVTGAYSTNRTITAASCAINGVVPTKATNSDLSDLPGVVSCLFATVPSGTTGTTVTIVLSGGLSSCAIHVYRVVGRPNIGSDAVDSATASTAGGTSVNIATVDISASQFMLAGHIHNNTNATTSPAVPATMTENYDLTVDTIRTVAMSSTIQVSSSTPSMTWSWSGIVEGKAAAWAFG